MKRLKRLIEWFTQIRFERLMQRRLNRVDRQHNDLHANLVSMSDDLKRQKRIQQRYYQDQINRVESLLERLNDLHENSEDTKQKLLDHNEELLKARETIRIYEDVTVPSLIGNHDLSMEMLNKWTSLQIREQRPEPREAI